MPLATAVTVATCPLPATVNTAGSEPVQVTDALGIALPFWSRTTALTPVVAPEDRSATESGVISTVVGTESGSTTPGFSATDNRREKTSLERTRNRGKFPSSALPCPAFSGGWFCASRDHPRAPLPSKYTGRYANPKNTSANTSSHTTYHGHANNRKGDAVTGASHKYM